jgi:hypothetical protein
MSTAILNDHAASSFTTAKRVQESVLARAEKRALIWMAEHTPSGINSDHLTILGFAAQIGTGACYALAQ